MMLMKTKVQLKQELEQAKIELQELHDESGTRVR